MLEKNATLKLKLLNLQQTKLRKLEQTPENKEEKTKSIFFIKE